MFSIVSLKAANEQRLSAKERALSHARLLEVLGYDPETGLFFWKKRISIRITVGAIAGSDTGKGYIEIGIDGHNYFAHRLAWFYEKGEWPKGQVDHKDTIRTNNRIKNLRDATHGQNVNNSGVRANNTSGYKGVSFAKNLKKWHSRIMSEGQLYLLGYFDTPEEAYEAYCRKAKELHGEFARIA